MRLDAYKISMDLKPVKPEMAMVSVLDRGFLFGDSVYEVVRTYEGKLFTCDEHLTRLWRSAKGIFLELPFTQPELRSHIESQIKSCGAPDCYVRIVVSRGASEPDINPLKADGKPTVVTITKPIKAWPQEFYDKGMTLGCVSVRRNLLTAINPMIKSGNYLNNVLAIREALAKGYDDALMLNHEGHITESTTANIFFTKNGRLITPPDEVGILDGITRAVILKLAQKNNIPVDFVKMNYDDLRQLGDEAECFIASTTRELLPVRAIDQIAFRKVPGTSSGLTARLHQLFRDFVRNSIQ